jgi:hypothetical protein
MRLRVALGAVGVAMGLFGLLRLLQQDFPDIVNAVVWLVGGVLVHDAVVAPLTIAATLLASRVLPRRVWAVVAGALVVLLTVTITAIPVLGSWGARPDNPTLLDRDYVAGWLTFAAVVLLVSLIRLTPTWSRLRSRVPRHDEGGD